MLNVRVVHRSVLEISSELLVSFIFKECRPPKGRLGNVDWFLNGFISRIILEGLLNMECGKVTLIATHQRVVAPKLVIVGMGSRKNFNMEMAKESFTNIAKMVSDLKVNNIAFLPPDSCGAGNDEKESIFREVVSGMALGIRKNKIKEDLWFSLVVEGIQTGITIREHLEKLFEPFEEVNLMPS